MEGPREAWEVIEETMDYVVSKKTEAGTSESLLRTTSLVIREYR